MTCGRGYECTACGEHFRSLTDFDRHQSIKADVVVCASPEAIAASGLTRDAVGLWTSGTGEVRKPPLRVQERSWEPRTA